MNTTLRLKVKTFNHLFNFTTYHTFCSSPKTLNQLLNQRPPLSQIKQVHAQVITQSLVSSHTILTDSLIHCYLSNNNITYARTLFDQYPNYPPSILLWNIMIRSYSKLQNSPDPINLFRLLNALEYDHLLVPDKYTFTFLITSCTHQNTELHGMIIHGIVIKNGYLSDLYLSNALINFYAVFIMVDNARKVFDEMPERDVFSWTSLLGGYTKQGEMGRASEIFSTMPVRNMVSWVVIISGFLDHGMYTDALTYFHDMVRESRGSLKPNEAVLVCALSACASLEALDQGKWIHAYIIKNGFTEKSNVSTALIDMYSKCGIINDAYQVFNNISQPDVCNYTSMISGFSDHGQGSDALRVFHQMISQNITPNDITLLGVLKGCSHSGLVKEGSLVFNNMYRFWNIGPKVEHYGCFIDLLARAGYLKPALVVALKMHLDPDIVIWRALVSACRIYKDASLADKIVAYVERGYCGRISGNEVLLSNLYAYLSKWERVDEVRNVTSQRENESRSKSSIGCSWIEVNGDVHEFRVDDQVHPQIETLNDVLKRLILDGKSELAFYN
ncbi:pentatricopeptide repeat-containing protein At2g20540-like [Bidens hawaiensis]|uniref:pentatricopeptide repeat-containing protein At2g20540-like n=1 Tax=Bidens hawaiensis TaxID=980011 RepID=UPI00404B9F43